MHDACDFRYVSRLRAHGRQPFFVDQFDRCLLLHGVNVSGASKLPSKCFPLCLDSQNEEFWDPRATFVGRPFKIRDASMHFNRIKEYGLSLIRFVVMWEAIEHEPGIYDEAYLTYLVEILSIAGSLGLLIIVDCHQDCWSRFTGGSGAPLWTFEVAGLNPRAFEACGASLLQTPSLDGYSEPGTLWATNYSKLSVNTMFTLFFGGKTFAPDAVYEGQNAGEFLQDHYINCFTEVARRLKSVKGIVGFDVMNEPHHGFIGLQTLHKFDENILLHLGNMPSALQSMMLAGGIPQEVAVYSTSWPVPTTKQDTILINKHKKSAWLEQRIDIWREHGVYDVDGSHNDQYFAKFPMFHSRAGETVNFATDFYVPFLDKFKRSINGVFRDAWILVEPIPNTDHQPHHLMFSSDKICFAPHWYDLKALFEKSWSSTITMNVQQLSRGSRNIFAHTFFGSSGALKNYEKQYKNVVSASDSMYPRIIGETGIPFDMNNYYQRSKNCSSTSDNYIAQGQMLDIMCSAMERNLLSYTLWNYTPENRAHQGGGDLWNGEDFSIYCNPVRSDPEGVSSQYAGARAPMSWIRPSATKVAGVPIRSTFDSKKQKYTLVFRPNDDHRDIARSTEIFLPKIHTPSGICAVIITGRQAKWHFDDVLQTLCVIHDHEQEGNANQLCRITVNLSVHQCSRNFVAMIKSRGPYAFFSILVIIVAIARHFSS